MCIEKKRCWRRRAIAIIFVARTTACGCHQCQFANSCADQYWVAPLGIISSSNEDAVPWDWNECYEEGGPIENTRQCIYYYFHAALQDDVAAAGDNAPQQIFCRVESWWHPPKDRLASIVQWIFASNQVMGACLWEKSSKKCRSDTPLLMKYHPLILLNCY